MRERVALWKRRLISYSPGVWRLATTARASDFVMLGQGAEPMEKRPPCGLSFYITRPFGFLELYTYARAVARRNSRIFFWCVASECSEEARPDELRAGEASLH